MGEGGIVPFLDEGGQVIFDSGVRGAGDVGVFSGLTGNLEIGIEIKIEALSGDVFSTQTSRNLFIEGISYMAGRDLAFMVNLSPGGFMILWRKDTDSETSTGPGKSH